MIPLPMGILLELTHRCPLQCPYCSNSLILQKSSNELDTNEWISVIEQAAKLGILQVHFSGGEPTVRKDLVQLVKEAVDIGLYTNLITSGVLLDEEKIRQLKEIRLDHLQLSFQDTDPINADSISNLAGSHKRKLEVVKLIQKYEIPLTFNFVLHRKNLHDVKQMIQFAEQSEVARIEIAHTQYYGWGLLNKDNLAPSRKSIEEANSIIESEKTRLKGKLIIDYVLPDIDALYPKKCMNGWGQQFINITPSGNALPCHAAETLPDIQWPSVKDYTLHNIWFDSIGFNRYRGTEWMKDPCKSCNRKEIDFGGCRCQAFALLGDSNATDPACSLSPHHSLLNFTEELVEIPSDIVYRKIGVY